MKRFDCHATSGDEVARHLTEDGCVIVEGVLSAEEVAAVRAGLDPLLAETDTGSNSFLGRRTKRVFAAVAKTRAIDPLAVNPLVISVLDTVLGNYLLSAPVVISIGPGEAAQTLHRDETSYPVPRGAAGELVVNVMWAIDDFTEVNGATRIIAGSHRWPDLAAAREEDTRQAVMPSGSICVFLGSAVHGGGQNRGDASRLGIVMEYAAGWLRPQENLALAVPHDVALRMPERLQRLIGYDIYPPFLGYVDGRNPIELLAHEASVDEH
jgi:ectoine hydroxylase-related dioxygenase (phytanoyl-CoA dioxygenase family)